MFSLVYGVLRASPPDPARWQIEQAAELGVEVLRSDLNNVVALVALLGVGALVVIAWVLMSAISVVSKQVDINAKQQAELYRQSNALDNQNVILTRMDTSMAAQLISTRAIETLATERNVKSDAIASGVTGVQGGVEMLQKDTQEILALLGDLLTALQSLYDAMTTDDGEAIQRIRGEVAPSLAEIPKLRLAIEQLAARLEKDAEPEPDAAPPEPPPAEPPAPPDAPTPPDESPGATA